MPFYYSGAITLFPHLIEFAENEQTITYSDSSNYIFEIIGIRLHPRFSLGYSAGIIGDIINYINTLNNNFPIIPPLNALVVNAKTRLPGEGFDWYKENYINCLALENIDNDAVIHTIHQHIYNFEYWRNVWNYVINNVKNLYDILEIKDEGYRSNHINKIIRNNQIENNIQPIDINTYDIENIRKNVTGGGGEGDEHRCLKKYVADNKVRLFGLDHKINYSVKFERKFLSADSVDVFICFEDEYKRENIIAVECKAKNASDADIVSGIFQCVKYKALLEAELIMNDNQDNYNIKVVLVVGRDFPVEYKKLANKLKVKFIVVK